MWATRATNADVLAENPAELGVSQEEGAGDEKDMSAADCGGMSRQGHVRCLAWGMPRKLRSRRELVGAGTEFGELEHDRRWVIHPQSVFSPRAGSEVATPVPRPSSSNDSAVLSSCRRGA